MRLRTLKRLLICNILLYCVELRSGCKLCFFSTLFCDLFANGGINTSIVLKFPDIWSILWLNGQRAPAHLSLCRVFLVQYFIISLFAFLNMYSFIYLSSLIFSWSVLSFAGSFLPGIYFYMCCVCFAADGILSWQFKCCFCLYS